MNIFKTKSVQFSQMLDDIKSWLSSYTGSVKVINNSTVFGQMLTVISALAHHLFLYIEDALVEQNKYTAQRKKSIYGLAAISGYEPSYGKASGVWIKIENNPSNAPLTDILMPNRTQIISASTGLYYNIVLDKPSVLIRSSRDHSNRYFYAVQGRFETQTFTSTGGYMYTQNLKYIGYIDVDHMEVRVNGEHWTREAGLYDMTPMSKTYMIKYNPIDGVDIIFGNNIYGMTLSAGDVIEVTYLLHDGEAGNLNVNEVSQFFFTSKLYDTTGIQVEPNEFLQVHMANENSISAGSNPESTETVKRMIGFNSRSLVMSDSNAYRVFLSKFAFVGYNRTWSEPGSLVVNSMIMKNYNLNVASGKEYFDLTEEDFKINDFQKTQLQNALVASGQQIAGSIFNILDIELVKYALFIYIKPIENEFDSVSMENQVRSVVGKFFGDIRSDSYIPKSDIINAIKNGVPGVDGVNCYILSERNESAIIDRSYEKKYKKYNQITGTWDSIKETVMLADGENPQLGLDAHGNIIVDENEEFPVLMGGWSWRNDRGELIKVVDPLSIVFE